MPQKVKLLYLSLLAWQFDEIFHNSLTVKVTPRKVKLLYLSPLALQFDEFFHIYQIYPLLRNGLTGVFQRTQCHLYSHHSGTKEIYHPSGPKKASL